MKTLISALTVAVTIALTAPAFAAGNKLPTGQAACEKQHLNWDAATKKCEKGRM